MLFKTVLLLLMCMDNLCLLDALKFGDNGVCNYTKKVTKTKRRPRPITVNAMCGKKKCKKTLYTEKYIAIETSNVCCNGWVYDSKEDQCNCLPPTVPHPSQHNVCFSPVCQTPCVNAVCVNHDTCRCHDGYSPVNATHCADCPDGYSVDEHLRCQPICENECNNSICTAPNVCSCNDGFHPVPTDRFTCEPTCDSCVNGNCVGPNQCDCHDGYVPVDSTHCEPDCDSCTHGDCIAPGHCVCHDGYTLTEWGCEPICTKCVNGFCVAPEVCHCFEGFVEKTKNVCYKPCSIDCLGKCTNGECVEECKAVKIKQQCRKGKCKDIIRTYCCDNWMFDANQDKCIPICLQDCINGTCTAPNTCTCKAGFRPHPLDKFACQPDCTPPCHHADCIAPNTCKCWEGYKAHQDKVCKPVCHNCDNGECLAPNSCLCNYGYNMVNGKCTPICSKPCDNGYCAEPEICKCNPGYELAADDDNKCNPVCEPKCENAICVAPNVCTCNAGFNSTLDSHVCKPHCDICNNGECVGPNVCKCHPGYILVAGNCFPHCSKPCMNGKCVEPDVCSCKPGYKQKGQFICEPVCNQTCVNSYCASPNVCECNVGYEESQNKYYCTPKCESCINGVCNLPNVCECNEGFKLKDRECVPDCSEPCVNSKCLSPNTCTCDEGFQRNSTHPNICFKPCEVNCLGGTCNINGECVCNPGDEFRNGSCETVTPLYCGACNGSCVADDECTCADGRPCFKALEVQTAEVTANTSLAGLELSWLLGGAFGLLLLTLTTVVMIQVWRRRQQYSMKTDDSEYMSRYHSSVLYAKPNTLITRNLAGSQPAFVENECEELHDHDEDQLQYERNAERLFQNPTAVM